MAGSPSPQRHRVKLCTCVWPRVSTCSHALPRWLLMLACAFLCLPLCVHARRSVPHTACMSFLCTILTAIKYYTHRKNLKLFQDQCFKSNLKSLVNHQNQSNKSNIFILNSINKKNHNPITKVSISTTARCDVRIKYWKYIC